MKQFVLAIILATISSGIIGIFIGAYFKHYFGISLQRRQEKSKAASQFREVFTDAIRRLEENEERSIFIFIDSIELHHNAVIQFRPYLSRKKAKKIQKVWKAYNNNDYLSNRPGEPLKPEEEEKFRKKMLNRIQTLLAFVKP